MDSLEFPCCERDALYDDSNGTEGIRFRFHGDPSGMFAAIGGGERGAIKCERYGTEIMVKK